MTRGCVSDDELQAYLERSLGDDDRAAVDVHCAECASCRDLLATAVRALVEPAPEDERAGELQTVPFDSYEIGDEVARGGLGRVVRARDVRLGRTVAIKELITKAGTAEERFVREALITARLEHPAIVPVHTAGRWPSGEPFYTMKLVSGDTLLDCLRRTTTLRDRLALLPRVLAVAEAMAYAHAHGVIHRDLKPANILVGTFGETVVVDWGLAKDLREREPVFDTRKAAGDDLVVLGTPPYMPPEQARGEPVDERADVYALGALLYHLLAGVPPYARQGRETLAAVLREPPTPVATLEPTAPRELVTIVETAMARDAAQRYPSATELAAALRAFQAGQLAGTTRAPGRARVAAVAGGAVLVTLVTGLVVAQQLRASRDRAVAQRAHAEARSTELLVELADLVVEHEPARAGALLAQLPASLPADAALHARELRAEVAARRDSPPASRVVGHATPASTVTSLDGRLIAASADATTLEVRNAASGTRLCAFAADHVHAFSPDQHTLAFSSGPQLVFGDTTNCSQRPVFAHDAGSVVAVAFSPDGHYVASTTGDSMIALNDLATGATKRLRDEGAVTALAFGPDSRSLATGTRDVRVWSLDGGAPQVVAHHHGRVSALQFSPDGSLLGSAASDGTVRVYDTVHVTIRVLLATASAIEFRAPHTLVTTDATGTMREWQVD